MLSSFTILTILTIIALVAQLLLTVGVLVKNSSSLRNRAFFFLSLSLLAWAVVNYVSETYPDVAKTIYVIRFIMLFAVAQNCFFVLFGYSLDGRGLRVTRRGILYALLSLATAVITLTPFLFSHLAPTAKGGIYPVAQPGMALFVVHAALSITIGFRYLLRELRSSKGARHQQMVFIFAGSVVLWGIVPITNFALSVTLQTSLFANFSPFYAFAFSSLIAYAVIKHRLFDIRLAIARTVTYLFLLFTLASMYALAIFGSARLFFGASNVTVWQNAVYVALGLFLAFTLDPLRRFFSRLTNRFFFQDIYNTDLVLDDLSDILVHTTSVHDLARRSLKTLNAALKAEAAAIVALDKKTGKIEKVVGVGGRRLRLDDVVAQASGSKQPILVLDEIVEDSRHLARSMQEAGAAVVGRMETNKERIGYVVFSYKSGGGMYTDQDLYLIQIAADELAVATQNALRFEEISHFNETLQGQVREATRELRESNKKLKSLDEAKDEFISMASHQLRTPLTSVKGYMSMVLEGDAGKLNPTQHQLLEQAFASSQRMVYLISDFLNVSRLQTGKFTIERTPVILSNVVQQEVNQLRSTAESRNLTIECSVPSEFPALQLDESKLRQAIMNFVDNAIFYSRPGGVIKVDLIKTAKDAVLTVEDSGIGVPMSERHHLFTKFYRASNARTARPDGTGIGLFMAKKVVVAHGGSIIFNSVEGKGSTFGFRLPLKQPAGLSEDHPKELKQ